MATAQEIADTVKSCSFEMSRRIDELLEEKHMDSHGRTCMSGIVEWLDSIEDALRHCNGKPYKRFTGLGRLK